MIAMSALQRGGDLEADEIDRVVETASPRAVDAGEPFAPDQHQHQVARRQAFLQHLAKVAAQADAVDVHEHRVLAQRRRQVLEQGPGLPGGVFPAVAQEYGADGTLLSWREASRNATV